MSYWDSSALCKLYFPEADSSAFEQKAANESTIVAARLALFEMRRVAFRKESEGFIPPNSAEAVLVQFDQDIATGQIRLLEIDAPTESEFNGIMAICYRRQPPVPIRTFDAIHLATARVAGEPEVVVTDKRMREAAKLLGFSVFPV